MALAYGRCFREALPYFAATTAPETTLLSEDSGERPWWRDFWAFLTGDDLVRDG